SRPTADMHYQNPDHPAHDVALIASAAAGDVADSERPAVEALLASCTDCADLHRDLTAIADATRQLPPPLARRRDFQLTQDHAARLRRGSWLRAALRPFGATGSRARPMAATFTTLGIAGLLVAGLLPSLSGGAATLAPERAATIGAAAA